MKPALHLATPEDAPTETVAQRIRRLQSEAKALARDHAEAFVIALGDLQAMAAEINSGGEAYAAGVRQIAAEVGRDCERHAQNLNAINGRM